MPWSSDYTCTTHCNLREPDITSIPWQGSCHWQLLLTMLSREPLPLNPNPWFVCVCILYTPLFDPTRHRRRTISPNIGFHAKFGRFHCLCLQLAGRWNHRFHWLCWSSKFNSWPSFLPTHQVVGTQFCVGGWRSISKMSTLSQEDLRSNKTTSNLPYNFRRSYQDKWYRCRFWRICRCMGWILSRASGLRWNLSGFYAVDDQELVQRYVWLCHFVALINWP